MANQTLDPQRSKVIFITLGDSSPSPTTRQPATSVLKPQVSFLSKRPLLDPSANKDLLIVNQEPDIALKVDLNYKTPDLYLFQKQLHLGLMASVKDKLEGQMDVKKVKFEQRLKNRQDRYVKLKELVEMEEYERNQRLIQQKIKREQAYKKIQLANKQVEEKQYQEYKEYLQTLKNIQHEKELQHQEQTKSQMREIEEEKLRKLQKVHKSQIELKKQAVETQHQLVNIDMRLQEKSERYLGKLQKVRESRNEYIQKVYQARTEYFEKLTISEIENLNKEIKKFKGIIEKRETIAEQQKEFKEQLSKFNTERIEKKKQARQEIIKERENWSYTVLRKHQKQWDQVQERHHDLNDSIRVKKEVINLKRVDQTMNYYDNIREQRQRQNEIQFKHTSLNKSLIHSKRKLEDLQQNQRVVEMQKKLELFADQIYCQTLKPKNKLLDVSYKRQILKQEPTVRSKVPIMTIKPQSDSEDDQ